jgi:hypothetical protein
MFERILAEMQEAARVGLVYLTEHARDEMADDGLTFQDVINCCLSEGEMAVVAKLTYNNNVGVITVYRLRITDYD